MINTVIFDIGNVLVDFDWNGFIHRMFPGQVELIEEINSAVWGGGRWDSLDAGKDPEKVFAEIISCAPKREKELRKVFAEAGDILKKRPEVPAWLNSLKDRGYRLLYLSNYSHYVMEANPGVLDFLPLMDGGVFSCDVYMIKPQRGIYECLAKKYNLEPSECVFIDDLAKNINAALELGFHGIQCITLKQAQKELEELLQKEK